MEGRPESRILDLEVSRTRPMRLWTAGLLVLALLPGCLEGRDGDVALSPVAAQQAELYPEATTGRFVSLIDFESVDGDSQVRRFVIAGADGGRRRQVYNITRTGAGAMEVQLPPNAALVFRSPEVTDFRPYTLLSLSVYVDAVRDDLEISLTGPTGGWTSSRRLLQRGWNTVLVDLTPLAQSRLDLSCFTSIGLRLAAAVEPVTFYLDDLLLIDNRREIANTPEGMTLTRNGLNYTIEAPGWAEPFCLRTRPDGLARMGLHQPAVQVAGEDHTPAGTAEDLRLMGERKVGRVELIEVNPIRVRIANTWFFPPVAGQWFDMDVRHIRWEYTFYGDGRLVTSMLLNNAGGDELSAVTVRTITPAAFSTGRIADCVQLEDFDGLIGRCSILATPTGATGEAFRADFVRPAEMRILLGAPAEDVGGFRASEGCFVARAVSGNCRLELRGSEDRLHRPILRVLGPWTRPVAANCNGVPLHTVPIDGGVLLAAPKSVHCPAVIEIAGTDLWNR